jgi:glycosyltransferase involved in cell wall biosynthesis
VKIALVTRRYPPLIGGAERVLSYLAPALAAEGADVTVLTAQPHPPQSAPSTSPVPVNCLPAPAIRILGTWIYMRSLRAWFAQNAVDIAYVSMLKHDAYATLGAGRKHGFPVVLRPEGAGATGDIAWQSWGRFGRIIGERCKQADAVVAISAAIEQELRVAGYRDDQIVALPNGVPIPAVAWKPRPNWQAAPAAAFVGRLAPEKSLETLIDAWPIVRQEYPTAILTIIGEGPERPSLDARIKQLGLTHAITLPGPSPNPSEALEKSDLFVLPSREEGMSIALLEAMALGIPLVATDIPGNRALVTDYAHGRLVPPGDPAAIARAVLEQWAAPDKAARMAGAARERARKHYSISAVAKRHIELFERLVRARPRR